MTVRNPVICISCDSKIITRTQIGHKDMQKHSFPCPTFGVVITYILALDQDKASFEFRAPENGTWADDEDGAVKTLTSRVETLVREALSFCRRRVGVNSVSSRACFHPNYRTLSRVQTTNSWSCKRPHRYRTAASR